MDEFASRLAQWLAEQPEVTNLTLVHNAKVHMIWGFSLGEHEDPITLSMNVTGEL